MGQMLGLEQSLPGVGGGLDKVLGVSGDFELQEEKESDDLGLERRSPKSPWKEEFTSCKLLDAVVWPGFKVPGVRGRKEAGGGEVEQ